MSILLTALVLFAFEFDMPAGPAASMLAGGAVPDWQGALTLNPALVSRTHGWSIGGNYCRPYGLGGLNWARAAGVGSGGDWAFAAALTDLSFDRFREWDLQLAGGLSLPGGLAAGAGLHCLVVDKHRSGIDVAPVLDLGVHWERAGFQLGAAVRRVNMPRFANGDEVPYTVLVAAAGRPVETLLLASDLTYTQDVLAGSLGAEFRLIPQLGLRVGMRYPPLGYGAGVELQVGPVSVDYAYQYHAQLRDTHVVGFRVGW